MPGRDQVGLQRSVDGLKHAVEQHLLDAGVVVEVFQVAHAFGTRSTTCACSDGRACAPTAAAPQASHSAPT